MMQRNVRVMAGCAVILMTARGAGSLRAAGPVRGSTPSVQAAAHQDTLKRYCYGCHNERIKSGNLVLENLDLARVPENAEVWEKAIRKLRGGLMPPPGLPRPDAAGYQQLVSFFEGEIDRAAAVQPNPGPMDTFHRLNRVEYQNAIRDVLGLEINPAEYLPPDQAAGGFDNIAANLKLSPTLVERYLAASEKISRLAVGTTPPPTEAVFKIQREIRQNRHVEGLPFGTRGGLLVRYWFPVDATYKVTLELYGSADAQGTDVREGPTAPLDILIDGNPVHRFEATKARTRREKALEIELPVKAGPHEVGATFATGPNIAGYVATSREPFELGQSHHMDVIVQGLSQLSIAGPFKVSGHGDTPSRQRIFVCQPKTQAEELPCARIIASNLARQAYRRPVTAADTAILEKAYGQGGATGNFTMGIQRMVGQLLMSPEFLFRVERDRNAVSVEPVVGMKPVSFSSNAVATSKAARNYRISDLELASRLSFFLWSTVPDQELLDVATRGKLSDPAALEHQVRRMLVDRRADALVDNFVGQWLFARDLAALGRAEEVYPNYDPTLGQAFQTESRMFFASMLREDRSMLDLLRADYTFVNDRLARHYGIPNIQGTRFRRVTFPDDRRRGILGEGTLLAITAQPDRTSPVRRGKWIMENLLGVTPPPPPADVPPLKDAEGSGGAAAQPTMRERMAAHRKNPVCAGCHRTIDPLGFALENFDGTGQWRDVDDQFKPIDASGTLPNGMAFKDLREFREAMLRQPETFVATTTEKLMTYALGRLVEYYDMPAVRKIVRETAPSEYRMSSVIIGIVKSLPFQMRSAKS